LSSGWIVIGWPTCPRATSGCVTAATDVVADGAWTATFTLPVTGSERPSVTV